MKKVTVAQKMATARKMRLISLIVAFQEVK